jgi:serine/threonine protein kinase
MADPLIGRQLANFRIERLLGRGGMAQVYYAMDVTLERPVALKVINDFYRDNEAYVERFLREARVVASWRHDNIVAIYYADQQDGYPFYAMEYIEGEDLGDVLKRTEKSGQLMSQEDVLTIAYAMADALDYAHESGVVHRDIKPSNIMLANDGRIILTDFGLALELSHGSIGETFGSPHYISPEQAHRSSDAVPQSDIYSLGVVVYEMLVGQVPFDGDSITSVALQVVSQPPPAPRTINPNLNTATERVLLKVLSKNPAERHQTAHEFIAELRAAIKAGDTLPETLPPIPAPVATGTHPAAKTTQPVPVRNRRGLMFGIVGAVLALGILAAVLLGLLVLSDDGGDEGNDSNNIAAVDEAGTETQIAFEDSLTETESAEALPSASPTTPAPSATSTTADEATTQPAPTDVSPTATDIPPTFTNVPPPTTEVPPSATPLPATSVPTTIAPTQVSAVPTEAFPNGRLFRLLYDNNTFVVANMSNTNFQTNLMGFEALLADGRVATVSNGNPIEAAGTEWSRFYGALEPGNCISAEITGAGSWLRPSECRFYNAKITPSRTSARQFWLSRETISVTEIRVLYQGQEAARCPLHDGGSNVTVCEVKLP